MMRASRVFELVADDARRRLLLLLCEREAVDVPDAVLERGGSASADGAADGWEPSTSRQRTELKLYHVHLPKLVDEEVVTWDRQSGVVARGPRFEDVRPLLELLADNSSRVPQDIV